MNKKDYKKPAITVVKLQHQSHLLASSLLGVQTDIDLGFDSNGGDQGLAW